MMWTGEDLDRMLLLDEAKHDGRVRCEAVAPNRKHDGQTRQRTSVPSRIVKAQAASSVSRRDASGQGRASMRAMI